mgnify:CR=1 FL=1
MSQEVCDMRILILNGSPKKDGNTAIALHEMEKVFAEEGIETEIVQVGSKPIRGCIACGQCFEKADVSLTICQPDGGEIQGM